MPLTVFSLHLLQIKAKEIVNVNSGKSTEAWILSKLTRVYSGKTRVLRSRSRSNCSFLILLVRTLSH